jgi:hypothetical protein
MACGPVRPVATGHRHGEQTMLQPEGGPDRLPLYRPGIYTDNLSLKPQRDTPSDKTRQHSRTSRSLRDQTDVTQSLTRLRASYQCFAVAFAPLVVVHHSNVLLAT